MWSSVGLREVRTFLTLAEELHYGRTATRLDVTPSRVSQTIQNLEAVVGGRLFDRTSRRVRLTPLGEQMQRDMRPAYDQLHRAFIAAREAAEGLAGTLRLGLYSRALGGPRLVDIVRQFQDQHPGTNVQIIETGFARDQLDWLRHGDADLLVMRLPLTDPDILIGPIMSSEERVAIVATDHPLAGRRAIDYEELAPYAVSDGMLPREMMEVFVPSVTAAGTQLRRTIVYSIGEAVMRVATGEIVHPTVASFLDHYPHPDVTSVPIRDMPASQTALVWLRSGDSGLVRAFAGLAAELLAVEA